MDREVRAAESLLGNLAQRVGRCSLVMVLFCGALRGRTGNTHVGVVGDDGINNTSASAIPQWAGFGQLREDKLGGNEGSVEVLGHPECS